MEKETRETEKPRFCEVCQRHGLDYRALQKVAESAKLPKEVIDAMSVSVAVRRGYAEIVLHALRDLTGEAWTLDTVKVAVLPTFADFHAIHHFDLSILSTTSGVSFDIISMMLADEPVRLGDANLVLKAAGMQVGQKYTVKNVDVPLSDWGYVGKL